MKDKIKNNAGFIAMCLFFLAMMGVIAMIALSNTNRHTDRRTPELEPESEVTFDIRDIRR